MLHQNLPPKTRELRSLVSCRLLLQIAVLKETDGRGPFCSLVMAVVVVKDVVTFVCFAINMEIAGVVSRCASASEGFVGNSDIACMVMLCV